ncbi:MAG: hypothetical protein JWQ86_3615 [Mycobacterium sp.]|nr:hypothetical protein [Mycobacterium sp.]
MLPSHLREHAERSSLPPSAERMNQYGKVLAGDERKTTDGGPPNWCRAVAAQPPPRRAANGSENLPPVLPASCPWLNAALVVARGEAPAHRASPIERLGDRSGAAPQGYSRHGRSLGVTVHPSRRHAA